MSDKRGEEKSARELKKEAIRAEMEKVAAEREQIRLEADKLAAEVAKLNASSSPDGASKSGDEHKVVDGNPKRAKSEKKQKSSPTSSNDGSPSTKRKTVADESIQKPSKKSSSANDSTTDEPRPKKEKPDKKKKKTKAPLGKDTNDMPISSGDKDVVTLAKSNSTPSILSAVPDRLAENSKRVSAPSGALRVPVLDRSNKKLTEIDSDILGRADYLQKLYLFRNAITKIPSELGSFAVLQIADLSNNGITEIPSALGKLSKLKELLLGDNYIKTFPSTLSGLTSLTKLDLSSNRLKSLPVEVCAIRSLDSLNLAYNVLKSLSAEISQLDQLAMLKLTGNKLRTLPDEIGALSNLTTLELRENSIKSIPDALGQCYNLSVVDLGVNRLTAIPNAFGGSFQLSLLSYLDLARNKISDIPEKFFDGGSYDSLEQLHLGHNQISSLPDDVFGNLQTLTLLDLKNNNLKAIPETIDTLSYLSNFDISGNQIAVLPNAISALTSLQMFNVYGNKLTALPSLSELIYLTHLNVGGNDLESISIEGLESLEELFIGGNSRIKSLPDSLSETCSQLRVLYAHQTEISVIPDEVNQLISLEFLDVSHAKLTTIPKSIGDLSSLRVFVASHNQLETSSPRSKSDDENDNGPWDCSNFWENLVNVREVDLSYNKLKKIPVGLADFPRADVLLTGNPLSSSEKQSKSSLLNEYSEGKRFKVGLSETSGRRPEMEDRFLVSGSLGGKKHFDLFAVFDGHAGRQAADFAARTLPDLIYSKLKADPSNIEKIISDAFDETNAAFKTEVTSTRDMQSRHCGATAAMLLIVDNKMYAANVGDARIVASGGVELTQDHKPRGEIDRIRKHEGGFVLGDNHGRINGLLAVSRSIGDFYMHPYVVCTPYQSVTELTPDVKFAIVACDGIWDEISSKQATKIVADLVAAGKLTEACIKLRDTAYAFGSDDNISVMIVKFH